VNKDSTPITVFLLFMGVNQVVVVVVAKTNKYYKQYLDKPNNGIGYS
jgi:hypothetical protein